MSVTVQSGMRAAYVAAQQQVTAPVRAPRAEAQEKPEGGIGAAYTVEISEEASAKYAAAQKGGALPQEDMAQDAADALSLKADESAEEQVVTAPDEGAAETGEESSDQAGSPLEARLEKLRKKLTGVRRSVLPDDEKKERIRDLKQQIRTLEGQIAQQQKAQNTQSA